MYRPGNYANEKIKIVLEKYFVISLGFNLNLIPAYTYENTRLELELELESI